MDFPHAAMWFLTNVATPLLAPIALLPLATLHSRYRGRIGALVYRSVKDGQLFWTVIAMCTAAMYEAGRHLNVLLGKGLASTSDATIALTSIGWHSVFMLLSSVFVLLGALEADEHQRNSGRRRVNSRDEHFARRNVFLITSIGAAAVTAVTFTATHFWAE
ncbi:hypothetical protein E4L96_22210 [Massilia arenosa]|uniref:DUF4149 domain-containing protein n=1 Tax=Zemynaea arenosa TaxID=2561931 RepID=A0A4Y9RTV2_9BURK|nr:hypothetical protein [Massilia arenosa]TFW11325.1 hypothetical protein E4L96_22210 [Massilia arenosa]